MKVLQLIDSLDAGGAERMAVQIANEWQAAGHQSYLCATRKEGLLKDTINEEVGYIFLEKKSKIGLKAMTQLKSYIVKNNIEIIHAHSTSFFTAAVIKWWLPALKIVWHDHYGARAQESISDHKVLKLCSKRFSAIISVNDALKKWSETNLNSNRLIVLPNFANENIYKSELKTCFSKDKVITCLANLRADKDHKTLINAFIAIHQLIPDWKLQLVGKDFKDIYSKQLRELVDINDLRKKIIFTGAVGDISGILKSTDIAVLSSKSEGLPVALLEYAMAGLPAVVTDVGACKEVVASYGKVVPSQNPQALAQALLELIEQPEEAIALGKSFQEHVMITFGAASYIKKLETFYSTL